MNKKILYTLSTIAVTSAPIVTVVACGKKEATASIKKRDIDFDWTDVAIEEYAINDQYHINDNVWKKISDRIKNDLNIGPEFNSIKKIIFGNSKIIRNAVNGFYNPSAKTMVINLERFIEDIYVDHENDTFADEFVEMMFQTIFHEYGHHIARTYLNVLPLDNSEAYIKNGNSWLGGFAQEFKDALNYDKTTTKLPDTPIYTSGEYNVKSIGSKYTAQDIYNATNTVLSTEEKNLSLSNGQDIYMHLGEKTSEIDKFDLSIPGAGEYFQSKDYETFIIYQYAIGEIFTRKYQQLKYIYDASKFNSKFVSDVGWGLYNTLDSSGNIVKTNRRNALSEDRRNYESQDGTDKTWSRFLEDRIFDNNNADLKLEELYSNVIGYKTNVDLSFIWNNNDVELDDVGTVKTGDAEKRNEIKFGGFLNNNENYTHVSFEKEDGAWEHLEIEVKDHFSGVKADIEATTFANANSTRKQYWIKDWINKDNIMNKVLHFSNGTTPDQTNSRPFATTRDDSTVGYATNNWTGSYWEIKGDDLIKATKDTDGVKISNWVYTATHNDVVNEYISNNKTIKDVHLSNPIYQI